MSYVAKIGDTEYPTLADAFAAANKTGDTVIELLDDINMTGKNWTPVSVDGNHGQGVITLNGNGKTLLGMPQWFTVSVFGSIVVCLLGVWYLMKKVFIDFEYDEEVEGK